MVKITGLEIDGYGVWSGLKLEGLSDGLNVLYGPNEAGKTTLLQFIRAVLYGFSPQRRYLPPLRGGRPGGSLHVVGPSGRLQIARHDDPEGSAGSLEQLALTAADGTRQGEHLLNVLLCHVDEATYKNVFAVGLREMQELGTLSDTEAASLLYNLTAGLDRVSLVEVMRELETSRNRILDRNGGPCQAAQLLAERAKLCGEIEELGASSRRYARLAAEQHQLSREVGRLEEELQQIENQASTADLAITLRQRWLQRAALDDQLAALGPGCLVPKGAVQRLDAIHGRLQARRQRMEQLDTRRQQLRAEAAGLKINEALGRQAARIEALQEQESWLSSLQNQIGELETEMAALEKDLAAEHQALGLDSTGQAPALPTLSERSLRKLRAPAAALRSSRDRSRQARAAAAAADETARALTRQIESALAGRQERDLGGAMDRLGNLVVQLRRRLQLDDRLDQTTRYQADLEEQGQQLLERQVLPVGVLAGLGGAFALGVMLVLAGIFLPGSVTGSLGWALAVLGLAGSATAALAKILIERSNARRLQTCQKQVSMLQSQIQQAKQERNALDQQLPRGGGPIVSRLAAAEKELVSLEELVPLDTRRTAAQQEAEAAARRVAQAEEELAAARRRWRAALGAAGLPEQLSPAQIRRLTRRCGEILQTQRRLTHRREELQQRRGELESLAGRIAQLVSDSGLALEGKPPVEQLRLLAEALAAQGAAIARRDALRRRARQIRRHRAKQAAASSRLKHLRRRLLLESGAESEDEFRQQALRAARAEALQQERQSLSHEIAAAIAGRCAEEAIGQQLQRTDAAQLEVRRDQLHERLAALQAELKRQYEHRGQVAEQLQLLAGDRQMAMKQLELTAIEKRLDDAVRRWQVLAVTSRVLDQIRTTYEQERQPEALQEASGYLNRLTQGRYRRVWTPLGEHVLRVDDADRNSLPVEALSRGTREQLFLSLRLALAACYARRGAPLPLVLDDVLVNFDAARAKAAAAVLRDFAAAGHQLLVFTCHEHILKLFKALKVPVSRLPDNAEAQPAPINLRQPSAMPPRRDRKAEPISHKVAAKTKRLEADKDISQSDGRHFQEEDDTDEAADSRFARGKGKTRRKSKRAKSKRAFDADYFEPEDDEEKEQAVEGDEEEEEEEEEEEQDDEEDLPLRDDDETDEEDVSEEFVDQTEDEYQWEDEDEEDDEEDYDDDESADAA